MDALSACALIYNIKFSLNQYQELRLDLLPRGFELPIRNDVDKVKKSLLLSSIISEPIKSSCDVKEVVVQTVSPLLQLQDVTPKSEVNVVAKFGLDGSGSHKIRHQKVDGNVAVDDTEDEEKETTSYLGGFWCSLEISSGGTKLCNPLPNSNLFARPLCLVREKETRESVATHFKPYMDKLSELEDSLIPISDVSSAKVTTEISMIDGKMVDLVQGDSGSFCHY